MIHQKYKIVAMGPGNQPYQETKRLPLYHVWYPDARELSGFIIRDISKEEADDMGYIPYIFEDQPSADMPPGLAFIEAGGGRYQIYHYDSAAQVLANGKDPCPFSHIIGPFNSTDQIESFLSMNTAKIGPESETNLENLKRAYGPFMYSSKSVPVQSYNFQLTPALPLSNQKPVSSGSVISKFALIKYKYTHAQTTLTEGDLEFLEMNYSTLRVQRKDCHFVKDLCPEYQRLKDRGFDLRDQIHQHLFQHDS
ncbi:MAG: hypothetical protein HRT90_03680 [Candidatus Margulisbacteria bacterium]|nr:hypothetical protein [Candidatus Margulisiibacteriota bacterium]